MQFAIYGFLPDLLDKVPVRKFWVYHFKLWYQNFISNPENENKIIIVTDVRFPHEASTINEMNGLLIRVDRPDLNTDDIKYQHSSETSIDEIEPHWTINNNGTLEELYKKIDDKFKDYNFN